MYIETFARRLGKGISGFRISHPDLAQERIVIRNHQGFSTKDVYFEKEMGVLNVYEPIENSILLVLLADKRESIRTLLNSGLRQRLKQKGFRKIKQYCGGPSKNRFCQRYNTLYEAYLK